MQKKNVERQNYEAPRVERIAFDEQSFLATSPPINVGVSVGALTMEDQRILTESRTIAMETP